VATKPFWEKNFMNQTLRMKKSARGSMLWGFLMVILGLFAMLTPAVSGIAVTLMLAVLLLISGLGMVIYSFSSAHFGQGMMRFLFGGITALAGIYMFAQPGMALASLTLFLAMYFVVDGLFSIIAGFRLQEEKGWIIFNGVVTLLLGAMIWKGWPVSGLWAVGILVGVKLVVGGMVMMAIESVGDNVRKDLG
jgi:uncharacterized membrane protein HdeD (DUF308 family)